MPSTRVLLLAAVSIGFSLACGLARDSSFSKPAGHADGEQAFSSLNEGLEILPFRPLEPAEAVGRRHFRVRWTQGRIAEYTQIGPSGRAEGRVQVEQLPGGGARRTSTDAYGVLVATETWTSDGRRSRVARSGEPTIDGCTALQQTFDGEGRVLTAACLDPSGNVVIDTRGCQVTRWSYGELGDPADRRCFDPADRPLVDGNGVHAERYKVDDRGRVVETEFLGPDGAPTTRASDGCARWRTTWDAAGNAVSGVCLNLGGLPTSIKGSTNAGEQDTFDANGCREDTTYVDSGYAPTTRAGIARVHREVDTHCSELLVENFTPSGVLKKPSPTELARAEYERNAEGLVTRMRCQGNGGEWILCHAALDDRAGGSVKTFEYDTQGRAVCERAFNLDGEPTEHAEGSYPHQIRHEYDERGRETKETFADAENRPARALGVWAFELHYDPLGALVSQRNLDAAGTLARAKTGEAEDRFIYDEKHRLHAIECHDKDGGLTSVDLIMWGVLWPSGSARVELLRDDAGTVVENVFTGPSGSTVKRVNCTDVATPCYRGGTLL